MNHQTAERSRSQGNAKHMQGSVVYGFFKQPQYVTSKKHSRYVMPNQA